jgi:hypothetical protein
MTMSGGDNAIVGEKFYPKSLSEDQGRLTTLAIEEVYCDSAVQPRDQLNRSVVRDYFELMQAGETFPPLQIVAADNTFLLVDGYHRLEAAKLAKLKMIRCLVREGDRRYAILLSSKANVRHGLRRTIADKRRAVMKVLADVEWRRWSDRQIARHCRVSPPFVSQLRSKMGKVTDNVIGDNQAQSEGMTRRFITKHGRPSVMQLPARQRSSAITSESIQSPGESRAGPTKQTGVGACGEQKGGRAQFIEVVVNFEKLIRATDVTAIRADPAADNALCARLKTLAQLIVSKADMIVQRG